MKFATVPPWVAKREGRVAQKTFTESVSLSGSNSFAWNAASNWVGGTLPGAGDTVVIGADSPGVSFDDLDVGARLLSVQVLNAAADPGLEIAQNVTLSLSGPLVNLGTVTVDAGAELTAVRVDANNRINVAGVLGIHDFNQGSFAFEGANAEIFLSAARPVWHNISANPVT
ncbi:MAG TPA: hypothetical protein VFW75_08975, partial [Acetobacteraceae bacterium]|nr:hypothetical protein [Acetobacteraceae bacterium]